MHRAMAPVSDHRYFPSLSDCLSGEQVLLSWKHVATALSDHSGTRQKSPPVIRFLSDDYVQGLLKDPTLAFAPPNDATKKDFETKTAPINVTSAATERYDVKLIKEDAQWLSQSLKLNLVAALRIIALELLSRPSSHLLGPFSTQDAANVHDAAGVQNGQRISFMSELESSATLDAEEIVNAFDRTDSRRRRFLSNYLAERRYMMMTMEYLQSIRLYGKLPIFATECHELSSLYKLKTPANVRDESIALLSPYLKIIITNMSSLGEGLRALTDDKVLLTDDLELDFLRTTLTEVAHSLSLAFQVIDSLGNDFPPSSIITKWFQMMDFYNFFNDIQPIHPTIGELIMPLKTLAVGISLTLLKPEKSLIFLAEREEEPAPSEDMYDSYLILSDVLEQVHKTVMNAASLDCDSAMPVIFTWTLLLHRMNMSYQSRTEKRDNLLLQSARETFESGGTVRPMARRNSAGSIFSIESSKFDGFLENTASARDLQIVEQLAAAATAQGKVFDVMAEMASSLGPSVDGSMTPLISSRLRNAFFGLLKVSSPIVGYQSEPVSCLLSQFAQGSGYWRLLPDQRLEASQDVLTSMLQDDYAMEFFLHQAIDRYPFEFLPFISMCKALCTASSEDGAEIVVSLLTSTPTITFVLPDSFQAYELVQEDENTNAFILLEEISLISLSSAWSRRQSEDEAFRLPAGTYGRFITDAGRVVLMDHTHSSLSLLGRRLEINLMKESYRCELGMLQPEEISEVVTLFATLLRKQSLRIGPPQSSDVILSKEGDLLAEMSRHISGGRDIVSVVCDTMDHYMQDEAAVDEEAAINILTAGVKFLDSILTSQPSRVWSYLARSELLYSDARAGKLAKIIGNLDLVSERFEFLKSSLLFFARLVDTAMASAVQRQLGSKVASRQKLDSNPWRGTADKILSKVSLSIARVSVDVFESTSTWRFETETSRIQYLDLVIPVLNKIIKYSYGTGESPTHEGLNRCLQPAASHILDCFTAPASGALRFQPVLCSLLGTVTMGESTLYPIRTLTTQRQAISVLELSTTLLRASDYLGISSTMFQTYIFKISTLVARLCAVSDVFRTPTVELLEALIVTAASAAPEPPSLLGYLGPQISKSFLQVLAHLGQPFDLATEVGATWKFFSSILRNKQQWMSNCLLTGQTPREVMKHEIMKHESRKSELQSDSVFTTALGKLKKLKDLEPQEALAVMDFVASAQNFWPWTVFTFFLDTSYVDGLRAYIRDLKPSHLTVKSDGLGTSRGARVAAYAAEILAMQLYHSRHQGGSDALAKSLLGDLDYYLREGVEVAGYNKSLHNNFAKNFANKYAGCSVDSFKRTELQVRELGDKYYYDVDRADDMLKFDPGWLGLRNNGFKHEMELANANLSLVDAQVALFHGWGFLLVELSSSLPRDDTFAKYLLQVAQQCLNANQGTPGPGTIFEKLDIARADLALALIQALAKSSLALHDIHQLLSTLVGTILAVEEPFAPDFIAYYRTLLKALFIALRLYRSSPHGAAGESAGSTVAVTQLVLNVLDRVIGLNFHSLVSLVHDNDSEVTPEDLALFNAILQACLSLPSMDQSQTQILNIVATHDVINAATCLYSWSDKLAQSGDPVYGELSILFLLELSTQPLVAEQLACEGVLSSLLSANLSKYMLRSTLSPYADAPIVQRCYTIWVKGFLPLMLNLLAALGATVAPEIAYVLNQFAHLLEASVDRFEAPGVSRTRSKSAPQHLTLVATFEIDSLALLTRVLSIFRANNNRDIPAVQWDAASILENVEFWLSSRRLLKERILPLGAREVEWRNTRKEGDGPSGSDNILEERIVSQLETVRGVLSEEFEG